MSRQGRSCPLHSQHTAHWWLCQLSKFLVGNLMDSRQDSMNNSETFAMLIFSEVFKLVLRFLWVSLAGTMLLCVLNSCMVPLLLLSSEEKQKRRLEVRLVRILLPPSSQNPADFLKSCCRTARQECSGGGAR